MKQILWLGLFLIFFSLPSYAQEEQDKAAPSKTFHAEYFELDNGLRIVVIPNNRAPVAAHMVWYRVGAADEKPAKSGIAHFLEHLMFKGSTTIDGRTLQPGEFSEIVKKLGGQDNAFTSYDYTAYFQSIAVEHLEEMMQMEAGRMRGLKLSDQEVNSERSVILEERRQRTDNNPAARFNEQINAALFINHPYATPVIGWKHEMETLNAKDAREFYDRWYVPSNATLVVSGDVSGQEVLDMAKRTYGKIAPSPAPVRSRAQIPPLDGESRIVTKHPRVRQAQLQKLYLAPNYRSDQKDALALQVLEEIMSGGSASRLYQSLVVDQKVAVNVAMGYDPSTWDTGDIYFYAVPAPGVSLEDLEAAIDAEIQKLLTSGVTETERQEAITRLQDQAVYARDSLMGPAMILGRALVSGSSIDDIEYWPDRIADITAADIMEAAEKVFGSDNGAFNPPATGYLMPMDVNERKGAE